ncbi:MAG: hypothetical protein JNM24_16945 [Bdellovibrionaceae bacterium]|nr:hypothetical protein [Pseudobdellovibrionaceae bacterium]
MSQFKLVVLDYAKMQIHNPIVRNVLNDIIVTKQINFERADVDYVALDKHDMIGTHYLIYDTSDIFQPKLVAAIRSTYPTRAEKHHMRTPLLDLLSKLPENCQEAYQKFNSIYPLAADCGSLVVDSNYTFKSTGLKLIDICYAMIYIHARRMGYNNILGCTNEKFRSSRWLENIGSYQPGLNFIHPIVSDPHLLIMIEKFNVPYIESICAAHEDLFKNIQELVPSNAGYMDIKWAVNEFIFNNKAAEKQRIKVAG